MSALADEEVPDLVATEIEHERSPVGVQAATRIVVLVQRGAVEAGERPGVVREVRGDPVEQHTDAAVVQHVDHLPQRRPGCRSAAWARRTRDLVAPRAGERMLHHRHELHVGEAEVAHVVGQLVPELRRSRGRGARSRDAPRRSTPVRSTGATRGGGPSMPRRPTRRR